jgi:hypothetical protein
MAITKVRVVTSFLLLHQISDAKTFFHQISDAKKTRSGSLPNRRHLLPHFGYLFVLCVKNEHLVGLHPYQTPIFIA